MEMNKLILGQNQYYSLDSHTTKLNNNVLVVGASGSGKTRGIVIPNLLQATGSYIVTDPKGTLYSKYKGYLEKRGYVVKKLDFTNPEDSARYNFFNYIRSTMDILKISEMLIEKKNQKSKDPFWDEASKLLIQAAIAYLREEWGEEEQNLHYMLKAISACEVQESRTQQVSKMDVIMSDLEKRNPDSYALSQYKKFRTSSNVTLRSILISTFARLGAYDTPEIQTLTASDDIDIPSIGQKKTALFVVVSDSDRSIDGLVNIFFSQAMNELCTYADRECEDHCLPVPVRFIMDDFATNCKIEEFPRMISSIRSRGISTMLMIQAESQLTESYGDDGKTIIGNCDSYVYLGGNDVSTAKAVAERINIPLAKVLNMPVETNWIFRRGQSPINGKNIDLDVFVEELAI